MAGTYYFAIVGQSDKPIFEMDFIPVTKEVKKEDNRHQNQFMVHAVLELVDEHMWKGTNTYLKSVDKFNQWFVSAFVTATQMRFVMVHDVTNEDGVKNFFTDVYKAYIKLFIDPFYRQDTTISFPAFQKEVQLLGKKNLT
ncbi:trafficking protein particle complex subunit 2-like [Maniola jurtina]|uniref:trafficking protein particle complex subunit 2-like n=1 Tax=Maniola jurtina TaxID=191418 RepID=UPI001E68708B|nr:trafficking protein particle complex subunit 2-like [Maniola jurtina]XP_045779512.1 trafficking protein particle complex subunit 2-like [Maniola jurtina]